ncbi:hypothetical protein KI688_010751 [Linnemannia hyalina]|uniref:Uncharacterized protein n=1 Tax=Linnemannia hyalina TaxID=64524 RepID=A0A9P7XWE5_9FUNG|nr:hypothetical protein KI688_010751 [Linnemannia hyalina]
MGKINEWGVQATNSYNAARKREYKRAVDRGRQVPRPVPIHWWPPSDADHVRGFSSIGGARAVHSGSQAPDRDEKPMWNVSDLLRGITPLSMLTEWSAVFRTPMSIAKTVLHKFVGYLEAQASELIWKPRCSETIAWEQSQGISAKDKTSKYTGPRGDWSQGYGYITHDGFFFTFYSNSKDSHQRTHHIKKLHGMLPTLNSMQARKPNLYPTCVCRRCELEKEDNDHVWKCPSAAETTTEIWKEAMGKINEWGVQATNSYNAARKREYKRAVDRGRQVPRPVPIHWWPPSDADHVRGFSSIGGARAVHSGSPAPDRDEKPMWNVSDLLRGITPLSMLTEWSAVFRTPMSIAKTVLHKFVGYLEAQASELIWKPRCSETIAWEQSQGISAKDKTSKYTGPRGDWSQGYGYITHDGFSTIVAQSQVLDRTATGGWCTEEFGL